MRQAVCVGPRPLRGFGRPGRTCPVLSRFETERFPSPTLWEGTQGIWTRLGGRVRAGPPGHARDCVGGAGGVPHAWMQLQLHEPACLPACLRVLAMQMHHANAPPSKRACAPFPCMERGERGEDLSSNQPAFARLLDL